MGGVVIGQLLHSNLKYLALCSVLKPKSMDMQPYIEKHALKNMHSID